MQRGVRYDWDEHNKTHIAAQGVKPSEFEEVLANAPIHIETRVDVRSAERRALELGHTDAGRVLFVVWTPRGNRLRPVTAFDANRKTRSAYRRRRNEERQK